MNLHRTGARLGLVLAFSALLGACAVEPARPPPQPAIVTPLPEVPPSARPAPAHPGVNLWTRIASDFALHDCANTRLIDAKEALYTRRPAHFERLLARSLPLMIYVHTQLHAAGIPGEFVMLPMLESGYNPAERSRHGDAAGMWQLMPRTAHLRGVRVARHYDGRRDPIASTRAAVTMLHNLHRRFHDWRLVDMAYNAGPYAVTLALRKHPKPGSGAIPDLPLPASTRSHLAKLMALSCIVREPARFHVQLPKADGADHLAVVVVPSGTRIADVADMAEIDELTLRDLNPGYLGRRIPRNSPGRLLLPATAARSLFAALTVNASQSLAQVTVRLPTAGADGDPPLPAEPILPAGLGSTQRTTSHYRVHPGDTLWSIARHHHVGVRALKRWNGLLGNAIHPGEVLRIEE